MIDQTQFCHLSGKKNPPGDNLNGSVGLQETNIIFLGLILFRYRQNLE